MMDINKKETWFKLHSSCIPVKGKDSSLIYDIEKEQLYPISGDHYELLRLCKTNSLSEIERILLEVSEEELKNFLEQFIEESLGFYTSHPESFPELDLEWMAPAVITNGIIQLNATSQFDFENLVEQFQNLGCDAIQVRLEADFEWSTIEKLMLAFETTRIKLVDWIMPYRPSLDKEVLLELMGRYKRVGLLRIYGSPKNDCWESKDGKVTILLLQKDIRLDPSEIITPDRLTVNSYVFMEAQRHNVGLNRKVCVDAEGNIKNYLSHAKSWGNITEVTLKEVVNRPDFQEKWFVTNDKIERCCECSFRYCCVSNSDVEFQQGSYRKVEYCTL